MTDLTPYNPARTEIATLAPSDPTGRRLISWAEAGQAANQLARALSQTAFVPKGMTDVGNATAAILMGDELGLSPIASLRSIYVVHGTPALYARTMVALALSHGHQIWTESASDQAVTVCGQRRGSEHVERAEWTIQRATKAGYTGNAKYKTNPVEMLYAKAAAEVARRIAADVLAGVPYSVEDLELEQPATTTVTRESAARSRVNRARSRVNRDRPQPPEPDLPSDDLRSELGPESDPEPSEPARVTDAQIRKIGAAMRDLGMTDRTLALQYVSEVAGRDVPSRSDLTRDEASRLIDQLESDLNALPTASDDTDWPPEPPA
ncbi:hypothetical protein EDD28_2427 [Salana multivorans]|uniref:RecT family protein n=1 Tax=Salana multivorans TaxID=120377 RepID=A0A3N2DDT5_9MICO|nr:hypothetical protein [Salana multivorans]ROR97818.1 hypothetical protein EDD28_2427 [Salana multivorans]